MNRHLPIIRMPDSADSSTRGAATLIEAFYSVALDLASGKARIRALQDARNALFAETSRLTTENADLRESRGIWRDTSASQAREIAALTAENADLRRDARRLDWWFAHGLEDSVCDGSVDLWWADDEAECERVTHGTSVRDTIDKAMQGIYEPDDEPARAIHSPGEAPT